MPELSNSIFDLQLSPENGTFSIFTKDEKLPDIANARLSVQYRQNGQSYQGLVSMWENCQEPTILMQKGEHGDVQTIHFIIGEHDGGISFEVIFGILQEYPLVVWQVKVVNQSSTPITVDKINLLHVNPTLPESNIIFSEAKSPAEMGFFSNGWQSWSPSQWAAGDGKFPQTRLGGLQEPMIYNHGTPIPKKQGQFSSDFFAVVGDRKSRTGFLLGFLSQKNHFGSISADFSGQVKLDMWANGDDARLDPGKTMTTDWAVFNPILLDHRDPLGKYFEAVARENQIHVRDESPVGWCSWYHFYTHISERIIRDNLQTIVDQQETLPIQLVQIDDGFESQVGDWFSFKPEFPNGVKPLAEEILKEGLLPGLWLAPFIVHPQSELAKEHPDWLLRKANGKPVNAGYVWGALATALDLTVPEALRYACEVVKKASAEWNFPYLKLDFLYAAGLPGCYHNPTLTRAQVLRKGMEAIREAVGPDVTLLGCGAPLGSVLGIVEAMRIGADVSGDWLPKFNKIGMFIQNEPSMPCAKNSIRNILTRANLHKHWWINDPDCLLVRPETNLSLAEVQSLASVIALTGGSVLVSDDLPKLPKERLRIAESLLPVIGETARIIDWFDSEMPSKIRLDQVNPTGEWHILARCNWSTHAADLTLSPEEYQLPQAAYHYHEFWNGNTGVINAGRSVLFRNIPANGCVVAAVRRFDSQQPAYMGSDLHISQGLEVAEWNADAEMIHMLLRLPRKARGLVTVFVPGGIRSVTVNSQEGLIQPLENDQYLIPVEMDGFAVIEIKRK